MNKVLIIGPGGAGKSTFARRLGQRLNLEVIHLDCIYWQPGWRESAKHEWRVMVQELLNRSAWIMDGNYSGTLDLRLEACDTVVFLDFSRATCLWRLLKRRLLYYRKARPDMAPGCNERLTLEFLAWVWNYRDRTRPKVLDRIREATTDKKVIRLRSRNEVEKFFDMLEG